MPEYAIILEWLEFAARWLHVICAIAWIGSSFYFIALDLGLRAAPKAPKGVKGEEWQVHGGGFYHIEKYLVAPKNLPEHLIWFKWESYATWASGAFLLALIYWLGGELYLIDHSKTGLGLGVGVAISALSLAFGWVIYDLLCKSPLGHHPSMLMLILFVLLVAMGYGYNLIFTGRAMMLHLGAFTATIMSANVFFIIIPGQKIIVADMKAGRVPDQKYGRIAKLRSTHNNYLTLPVIFLMLSNHYPLAFASHFNWLIAGLIFLIGVLIRHFFNSLHGRSGKPYWCWLASALLFLVIIWLSSIRMDAPLAKSAHSARFENAAGFEEVSQIVMGRCAMCHAAEPVWAGIYAPPKGVRLDDEGLIAHHARAIYLHAGLSRSMPPGNITGLSTKDREAIIAWYRAGSR